MSNLYCGNNRLDRGLVNGSKRMGSRYQCFKRGIGVGLHTPLTGDESTEYSPIYEEGLFCGNGSVLPEGYKSLGQPFQCLRKGVGVGKGIQMGDRRGFSFGRIDGKDSWYFLVPVIISIITVIILILSKPKFVQSKDDKKTVNVPKAILTGTTLGILLTLIIYINY